MRCVDTTFLIDLTRSTRNPLYRRAAAVALACGAAGERLAVSRPAEAEFRVGPYRADDPPAEREKVRRVLRGLDRLELDAASARQFARYKAHSLGRGRIIGDMDLLIAAITFVHGRTLVTRNVKHFDGLPGLNVEPY